jgi:hypothetical protein
MPPRAVDTRPRLAAYTVPAGTACQIKRLTTNDWQAYTTKAELSFERHEGYRGWRYEFRYLGWFIRVHANRVIHRADLYPPGV